MGCNGVNFEMARPQSSPEEETMVLSSENENERLVVGSCQVGPCDDGNIAVRQYQSAGCVLSTSLSFITSSCRT